MSEYAAFDSRAPSPQDVNLFHQSADTDSSPFAAHHTLGKKPNQAAPGDHKHDDLYVIKEGPAEFWEPNLRQQDDSALAHSLLIVRFKVIEGICHWKLNVNIQANGGNIRFDLPVATNFAGYGDFIGGGRENAAVGSMLQVYRFPDSNFAHVFTYNNGSVAVNGYQLLMGGSYIVDQVP